MSGSGGSNPSDLRAQLSDQVKVLADKFLQRTAGQVLVFEQQLERLAGGDREVLTPMAEVAHKIHGSGAVFGFEEVSECAGRLELSSARMATEAGSAGTEAHVQWARQLTQEVALLSRALHAAIKSAGS